MLMKLNGSGNSSTSPSSFGAVLIPPPSCPTSLTNRSESPPLLAKSEKDEASKWCCWPAGEIERPSTPTRPFGAKSELSSGETRRFEREARLRMGEAGELRWGGRWGGKDESDVPPSVLRFL